MTLTAKRIKDMAHELAARSDRDVAKAIKRYDAQDKIALKHAIDLQREGQGISLNSAAEVPGRRLGEQNGSYWLRRLQVHGPIDLKTLEARMSQVTLGPELRIEIKCEAQERGWLSGPVGTRLVEERPFSLEMRQLYDRAGLEADAQYTPAELHAALAQADLQPRESAAMRTEMALRRQVVAPQVNTVDDWSTQVLALNRQLAALRRLQHQRF